MLSERDANTIFAWLYGYHDALAEIGKGGWPNHRAGADLIYAAWQYFKKHPNEFEKIRKEIDD